ncbi:MAG TPA: penicillin-binding protein [Terriglobales bacterium]|nr:penicillin-binding protein [Terriglobales bacterium]
MAFQSSRNTIETRLYVLGAILLLWCAVICLRLVYLQILRYGSFEQRAQHQQQRTVELSARRGLIYDRAGRELAMSIAVDSAFAVPSEIPDLPSAISLLARITKTDAHELLARCKAARTFCWVARKADGETVQRIRSLNLRGIYFQKESKRFYPKGELAAQVIGYVGTDDEGLSGIEREYDESLAGRAGEMLISVDARRKWFSSVEKQPEPGQNVVLTLDQQIQYIAEHELDAAMETTHAISGTVIVENPHTGEILALANRPTFNPNQTREITPEKLKNHAVSDVYEPGSTFKLVTISAALDENLTRPEEKFDCQMGSIVVFGRRIHDWKPYGVLSVSDILARSSDVGAIKIALRLGDERMDKYIRAFGFGRQTGIELPGETRGLAKPLNRWSKVSIGAIAMGQEIGISPLQLAAMVASIANDGVLVGSRIVASTTTPQSTPQTITFHPVEERRAISTTTAGLMRQMMQGVVLLPYGTGKNAILEGYSSAGKTGTAQKVDPLTHTYSRSKYIASFAGFAPVNNPAVVCVVILDSPLGGHHGGQVGGPVFHRIVQQVLEYLHAPHDVELPPRHAVRLVAGQSKEKEDDLREGSPDRLSDMVEMADTPSPGPPPGNRVSDPTEKVALLAPGPVAKQENPLPGPQPASGFSPPPAPPQPLSPRATVMVDLEQGGILVPSFAGKSVRAAIEIAEENGLDLDIIGSGLGEDQSPAAGAHVAMGSKVTVWFGR